MRTEGSEGSYNSDIHKSCNPGKTLGRLNMGNKCICSGSKHSITGIKVKKKSRKLLSTIYWSWGSGIEVTKQPLEQNFSLWSWNIVGQSKCDRCRIQINMAEVEVEDLVVHLERNLELSTMEQGVKLVGKVLSDKTVNKWGVRNILRASWKEMGEIEIKWVRDNVFIITVNDESTAAKILDRVPWGVMKQHFMVKSWSQELALEEVNMYSIPFWIQLRGIPPYLSSDRNLRHIGSLIGIVEEVEDPERARGFLRIKVMINTLKPLRAGCWLPREGDKETWVEFRYERLQDFCYKCGRIGHANTECSFDAALGGNAGFGDWMQAQPVRDLIETPRLKPFTMGERRLAGAARKGPGAARKGPGKEIQSKNLDSNDVPNQMAAEVVGR